MTAEDGLADNEQEGFIMSTPRGQAPRGPNKPGGDLLWLWLLLGALAFVVLAYVLDGAFGHDDEFDADRVDTARVAEADALADRSPSLTAGQQWTLDGSA